MVGDETVAETGWENKFKKRHRREGERIPRRTEAQTRKKREGKGVKQKKDGEGQKGWAKGKKSEGKKRGKKGKKREERGALERVLKRVGVECQFDMSKR